MTEHKHTPGPWFENGPWHIQAPSGIAEYRTNGEAIPELPKIVAHIIKGSGISHEEISANSALIAQAPSMLSMLETIAARLNLEAEEQGENAVFICAAYRTQINDLIKKARGEE